MEQRLATANQAKSDEQAAVHAAAMAKLQASTNEAQAAAKASADDMNAFLESRVSVRFRFLASKPTTTTTTDNDNAE